MQASDIKSVYASGTVYGLTNAAAALDFGTTDPVLTLNGDGQWLIFARVVLSFSAASFVASRTVTLKLRRTNNTAADLTGGTTALQTGITTTVTGPLGSIAIPPILYTGQTGDSITIFGSVSTAPSAGALNATESEIIAVRLC